MPIPETTSAESFWRYAGGTCLFESRGEAWRDIAAQMIELPEDEKSDTYHQKVAAMIGEYSLTA
jgi:hypothetical protein